MPACLLALPIEVLEVILQYLDQPQAFIRACHQLYHMAKSPFLRAKYLLNLHGPDQVLTRATVEKHKLTISILTPAVVSFLVIMGAAYRDRNEFIFRWACSKGHRDLVCQLLKVEPKIDLHLSSDWFLRDAAENGQQDVVALLVQQPAYVPSEYGLNKAFEAAYLQSHHSTIKTLLDYAELRGAQLESEPVAFHKATAASRTAKRVLAGGLSVQKDEDRALRYAVRGNDVEMVRLLLGYGANVHAFQENSITVASQMGHVEILKLLIQAGADVTGTPLRYAAENGHSEVVRVLCESGADTMAGGCGSLRTAASYGHEEIIATLLDYGANVNVHEGAPLQLACQHGHEGAVRVLLKYGANHRLDDGAAYKIALETNNEAIKALLIQAETRMRQQEYEMERVLRQHSNMMASSSMTRDAQNNFITNVNINSNGGSLFPPFGGSLAVSGLPRGHKRFYSQISSPLSFADLFRSGSVCGLVALDDEIRSRARSESNRL
ncbi:hypothetical protein BG000_008553 [Podila horticola]|nr:hypothetical protein BG000_008553 [Podila horticola]